MSGNFAGISQTPPGVQKVCANKVRRIFCSLILSAHWLVPTLCRADFGVNFYFGLAHFRKIASESLSEF